MTPTYNFPLYFSQNKYQCIVFTYNIGIKEYIEQVLNMRKIKKWFNRIQTELINIKQSNVILEIFLTLLTIGIGILLFLIITKKI
jgi:hypothetical protein